MRRVSRHSMAWIYWEPSERDEMLAFERVFRLAGDGDQEAALQLGALLERRGLPGDIGYYWPEHAFMIPLDRALVIRT